MLVVGLVGATVLHRIRRNNGRKTDPGQWIGDALNVATILLLGLIGLRAVFGDIFGLGLANLAASNGIIIGAALAYCIAMIANNLNNSIQREPEGAKTSSPAGS